LKYAWIVMLMALASPAAADNAVPDLLGTWKGESQSIVLGGSPHHPGQQEGQPRLTSVAFALVIDFSGTFSSARHSETVIAVVSRSGAIYMVDDGYDVATMLGSDRMEICYLHLSSSSRIELGRS